MSETVTSRRPAGTSITAADNAANPATTHPTDVADGMENAAISLPATSAAGAKSALRISTAYARIRKQFNLPIGFMEGVE